MNLLRMFSYISFGGHATVIYAWYTPKSINHLIFFWLLHGGESHEEDSKGFFLSEVIEYGDNGKSNQQLNA